MVLYYILSIFIFYKYLNINYYILLDYIMCAVIEIKNYELNELINLLYGNRGLIINTESPDFVDLTVENVEFI